MVCLKESHSAMSTFAICAPLLASGQCLVAGEPMAPHVFGGGVEVSDLLIPSRCVHFSQRGRSHRQPAITRFEQALQDAQLTMLPVETPREILVRAQGQNLPAAQLTAMQTAATQHERSRHR
jgi:hypothetical protein